MIFCEMKQSMPNVVWISNSLRKKMSETKYECKKRIIKI
jgi:hypothetical protein